MRFVFEIINNFEDLMKELKTVMYNLDFDNNFQSFTKKDVVIGTTETAITNELFPDIPSSYIILSISEGSGSGTIVKPTGNNFKWTAKTLYLKSTSGSITATILFLK